MLYRFVMVTLLLRCATGCVGVDETPSRSRDGGRIDGGDVSIADVRAAPPDTTVVDVRVGPTMDSGADTGSSADAAAITDGSNECSPACRPGHRCLSGTCRCGAGPACAISQECCEDSCVDIQSSIAHCGRCGNACAPGGMCSAGMCTSPPPVCSPACDAAQGERCVAPGVCVCGASGAPCPAGQVCTAGACGPACPGGCPTGEVCMGRVCVCGATGSTCPAGTMCRSGRCLGPDDCDPPCVGGTTCCAARCVNTATDMNHCGSCGTRCTPILERCCAPFGLGPPGCTPVLFCG